MGQADQVPEDAAVAAVAGVTEAAAAAAETLGVGNVSLGFRRADHRAAAAGPRTENQCCDVDHTVGVAQVGSLEAACALHGVILCHLALAGPEEGTRSWEDDERGTER